MTSTFHLSALAAPWTQGDRISLPSSVLEALHSPASSDNQTTELLTFQIQLATTDPYYNPTNQRRLAVGVRDFASSPNDATVLIPPHLLAYLSNRTPEHDAAPSALSVTLQPITLPKATSISLRPSSVASIAYQSIPDLRAVLEAHLRSHYTVLTQGTLVALSTFVPATLSMVDLAFHVEQVDPNWAATVVNTDVEVTVLPVTDDPKELARVTDEYKQTVARNAPVVVPHATSVTSYVPVGGYAQCFSLANVVGHSPSVPATRPVWLRLEVTVGNADRIGAANKVDVNLFFHPFIRPSIVDNWAMSVRGVHTQRALVLDVQAAVQSQDWSDMFAAVEVEPFRDMDGHPLSEIPVGTTVPVEVNWEVRVGEIPDAWVAEAMVTEEGGSDQADSVVYGHHTDDVDKEGKVQCNICSSWIAPGSLTLHQLHCARNTTKCATCQAPLSRTAGPYHIHCTQCAHLSTTPGAAHKHAVLEHPAGSPLSCPTCPSPPFPTVFGLAAHRRHVCPDRIHYCRFCRTHTAALAGDVSAASRLAGLLTPHQAACAARTVDCAQCGRPVTRRDVAVHMAMHKQERALRPVPCTPCTNALCGRVVPLGQAVQGGKYGLCTTCYSPLYSSRAPEPGKSEAQMELQRVVHRYFRQATSGCGQAACCNVYCKSGRAGQGSGGGFTASDPTGLAVECFDLAKRLVHRGEAAWFCVQPAGGRAEVRREVAEEVSKAHGWVVGWTLWAAHQVEGKVFDDADEDSDHDEHGGDDGMRVDALADTAQVRGGVTEEKRIEWATRAVEWLMSHAPAPATKS